MSGFMRLMQLASITIWVGGLIFFAFVLAPSAFQVLPVHEAGLVVGAALRVFDVVAMAWGALFLYATYTLVRRHKAVCRFCHIEFVLALAMLLATAAIHWGILPAMEDDRQRAGGDIAQAAPDDPARIHFDRLHNLSEGVESIILILGIGVVFLLSREMVPRPDPNSPTAE